MSSGGDNGARVGAIAAVLVALITGAFGFATAIIANKSGNLPAPLSAPTVTVTASVTVPPEQTAAPQTTPSPSTRTEPESASMTRLSSFEPLEGQAETTSELNMAGELFSDGILLQPDFCNEGDPTETTWQLDGTYNTLSGTVGLSTASDPGSKGIVEITVDGSQVGETIRIDKFQTQPLTVNLDGAVEVTVSYSAQGQQCATPTIGLGDVTLK